MKLTQHVLYLDLSPNICCKSETRVGDGLELGIGLLGLGTRVTARG